MEGYSKKTDEKMDKFLQTKIKDSLGTQFHGMNTPTGKMKEEGDMSTDTNKSMKESRIWTRKSPSQMKKVKIEMTNPTELMTTRIKAKLQ